MNHDDADVNAFVARADAHFSARRMTKAMIGYRKVLAVRPHDAHALHRMGLACVHTDEMDRARGYLEQALQAAPERAELWEHAGLLAALKGDHASAEVSYRRAISLTGGTASLHRNLADCLRLSGRLDEATTHYEKSIQIDSRGHHAVRALARICTELGKVQEAADYWQRAWMLDPASPQDGLDLIAALAKAGHSRALDDAIGQVRTRIADSADTLNSLAYVLNTHDRFSDALSVARQGLIINPLHPLPASQRSKSTQHHRQRRRKSAA
jgi:Tfp pilus assembly protein PilF